MTSEVYQPDGMRDVERMYQTIHHVLSHDPAKYYSSGIASPRYPVPALLQDSCSDLGERWSNWLDADRLSGHKY